MARTNKLAVVGFDSISLPFLETFVRRGVMPTVGKLMAEATREEILGWSCYFQIINEEQEKSMKAARRRR